MPKMFAVLMNATTPMFLFFLTVKTGYSLVFVILIYSGKGVDILLLAHRIGIGENRFSGYRQWTLLVITQNSF